MGDVKMECKGCGSLWMKPGEEIDPEDPFCLHCKEEENIQASIDIFAEEEKR